jgi:hypothetical protein
MLGEEQYELHTRWLWRRLWKGIISLSSKSTAILTAIMSNSASHFGGRNGFTGGGQILSLGGGGAIAPRRYIVKKGTAIWPQRWTFIMHTMYKYNFKLIYKSIRIEYKIDHISCVAL